MSAGPSSTMEAKPTKRSICAAARTSLDDVNTRHAQIGAQSGEYWLVSKDGEQDWPVVICDEDIVQSYFKGSRPENARKVDRTWPELFQPGGNLMGQVCFPVLYLGTLKLRWASWNRLKPLDFQLAVAIRDTTPDEKLKEAYHDAIGMYEWNRLNYWKDKLCALKLANATASVRDKDSKRKREATSNTKSGCEFQWPPGFGPRYRHGNVDEDEAELLLPSGEFKRRKIKKEVFDTTVLADSNALYEDSDAGNLFSAPKGSRSLLGRSAILHGRRATTPTLRSHKSSSTTPGKLRAGNTSVDTDKVTLYVGNPHVEFTVQQAGLDASPVLARLKGFHDSIGYYVMSPVLSSLSARDFKPIAQYVDHKEYYPNLLDENTNHARLEDVYEYGQRTQEILRCGIIYSVAHQVELPGLQNLAFRKLKCLQPYPPMEFLSVIGLIFRDGITEVEGLRRFVVQHLAEHFDELMTKETQRMLEFIKEHAGLARDMFRELGELPSPTLDIAPKADKEVEEEGKFGEQADEDGASFHVYEEA